MNTESTEGRWPTEEPAEGWWEWIARRCVITYRHERERGHLGEVEDALPAAIWRAVAKSLPREKQGIGWVFDDKGLIVWGVRLERYPSPLRVG